jgi:hypothetical protein
MSKKNKWFYITLAVLTASLVASFLLALSEFDTSHSCPKFFSVPVCYVVFILLLIAFVFHFLKSNEALKLFFFFISVLFLLAFFATVGEIAGSMECPRGPANIPTCYISLVLTSLLLVGKIKSLNHKVV